MNCTVNRKELLNSLNVFAKVISKKAPMPALRNSVLKFDCASVLEILGTNLDTNIVSHVKTTKVDSTSAQFFHCAVNHEELRNIVKGIKDENVEIFTTYENLCVKSAFGTYKLPQFLVADMPVITIEIENETNDLNTSATRLLKHISNVSFCMSDDWTRPRISSLLLDWQKSCVNFVATDGHRLAKSEFLTNGQNKTICPSLIGSSVVPAIEKLLTVNKKSSVHVWASEKFLGINCGNMIIRTKLIEETFPPYDQVIPMVDTDGHVIVKTKLFKNALDACAANAEKKQSVKLCARFSDLNLSTTREGFEPFNCSIPASNSSMISDDKREAIVGLSVRYLAEIIDTFESNDFTIQIGATMLDPIIVQSENDCAVHVVMPTRM